MEFTSGYSSHPFVTSCVTMMHRRECAFLTLTLLQPSQDAVRKKKKHPFSFSFFPSFPSPAIVRTISFHYWSHHPNRPPVGRGETLSAQHKVARRDRLRLESPLLGCTAGSTSPLTTVEPIRRNICVIWMVRFFLETHLQSWSKKRSLGGIATSYCVRSIAHFFPLGSSLSLRGRQIEALFCPRLFSLLLDLREILRRVHFSSRHHKKNPANRRELQILSSKTRNVEQL